MKRFADDATLVARCKRELPRQHDAFEKLVERHKDMVYTLCYRLAGEASAAEDLLQEIFTKIFFNLADFEEKSAFSSWLYRIAYNHCLNYLDKRKREEAGMSGYAEEQSRRIGSEPETLSDIMQESLNQLGEQQRSILILKYVMELELVEIAEILGVSVGAVKMRLLRSREEFSLLYNRLKQANG